MFFWIMLLLAWSVLLGGLTIAAARHVGFGMDELEGVQKVHRHWVPRLGGLPVFASFVSGCLLWIYLGHLHEYSALSLVACSLPAFAVGLVEDISRRAGIGLRLLVTMAAAALAWFFLDGQIRRLDIPLVDHLLIQSAVASFLLTTVAVAGVAHAVNIIDGYNGLCGFFGLLAFSAIATIAASNGDLPLAHAAFLAALSMVGFLFWNYPLGRLFLGDAGAYFIGFLIAEFCILLVRRNPDVSPWCALLIVIYPVWETLFSMSRRMAIGGLAQMGRADALHLHHLVFRRIVKRHQHDTKHHRRIIRNAMTTPYLLVLVLLSIIPAVIFSNEPIVLFGFCVLFTSSYIHIYRTIVRLGVPRWLVSRQAPARAKLERKPPAQP